MNRWASRNPEAMNEIAALPLSAQGAALAAEIELGTPDRDRIRDENDDGERSNPLAAEAASLDRDRAGS